jgi:hypothetical protein
MSSGAGLFLFIGAMGGRNLTCAMAIGQALLLLPQQKTPLREEGRFWGYYREERYSSLYMWIRGR